LIFEAKDKDIEADDALGVTQPVSLSLLVENEEPKNLTLVLYDKDHKKSGELNIQSRFIYIAPEPEPNQILNRNC
jgi:hypothetical protein